MHPENDPRPGDEPSDEANAGDQPLGNLPPPPTPPAGPEPILLDPADPGEGIGTWSGFGVELVHRRNKPPELFSRADQVVRIKPTVRGVRIEVVTATMLRWHLTRWGNWRTIKHGPGGTTSSRPAAIQTMSAICENMLAAPIIDEAAFPPLEGIIESPAFDASGRLIIERGYDAGSRLWLQPPPGLTLPAMPDVPSQGQVEAARRLLLDELLPNFPFVGDADKANALALVLLPSCRKLIDGPTPLHVISAPSPATGKSLLAQLVGIAPTGRETSLQAEKPDDNELRKVITTELREGASIIALDNLHTEISGSAWACGLTANFWKDRVLGSSKSVDLPVLPVWIATANSPTFSGELARRSVVISLDAGMENPGEREDFRHPLPKWAVENRQHLLWAALIIIQNWISRGRNPGRERLASFESWAATMGGILAACGVEGFLADGPAGSAEASDTEGQRWRELVRSWLAWYEFKSTPIEVIYRDINEDPMLRLLFADLIAVGTGDRRIEMMKLKEALEQQSARIYRGHRIVACHPTVAGTPTCFKYMLVPANEAPRGPSPRPMDSPAAPPRGTPGPESAEPPSPPARPDTDPEAAGMSGPAGPVVCTEAAARDAAGFYPGLRARLGSAREAARFGERLRGENRRHAPDGPGEALAEEMRPKLLERGERRFGAERAVAYVSLFGLEIGGLAEAESDPQAQTATPEPSNSGAGKEDEDARRDAARLYPSILRALGSDLREVRRFGERLDADPAALAIDPRGPGEEYAEKVRPGLHKRGLGRYGDPARAVDYIQFLGLYVTELAEAEGPTTDA